MVIIDIVGKIKPIIISEKLNIYISNLPEDWEIGIEDDIREEIYNRKFDVSKYSKYEFSNTKEYNLSDIIQSDYYKDTFNECNSDDDIVSEIARNLICIQIGYEESSLLDLKNPMICNPTCEKEFEEKFINFFEYLARDNKKEDGSSFYNVHRIYSSDNDPFSKTIILQRIFSSIEIGRINATNCNDNLIKKIDDLQMFGEVMDNYLESEKDFFKLDYLINAIYDDNEYNPYHLFKLVSLIEMLIVNPKTNGTIKGEFESKLPQFMPDNRFQTENEKKVFCNLVRTMRNKIAHGDFNALSKTLEQYATVFMKNYWFDYYEYSRVNWIYLNVCCVLDEIASKIIFETLFNKQEMIGLQNS